MKNKSYISKILQVAGLLSFLMILILIGIRNREGDFTFREMENEELSDLDYVYSGEIDYTRELANKNQIPKAGDADISLVDTSLPRGKKNYTVMIYMTGSNLESRLGSATKDLFEIREADIDYSNTNVIVLTGGSLRWFGDIPCDRNCVLEMSRPEGSQIVAQTDGNADMGTPDMLTSFINFCHVNYPAEHNALIFWDHGGGSLWGYGSDELFDDDSLLLTEMYSAMLNSPYGKEHKLDFVGFDACLMGSLECMSIWSDFSNYYIGSEELEPGDGWDYSFLETLNETSDTEIIAERIIDRFANYYKDNQSDAYNPDVTLACVDLSTVLLLENELEAASKKLKIKVDQGDYSQIQKIRSATKSFGLAEGAKTSDAFNYDLIDLGDFASQLKEYYSDDGGHILSTLEECVLINYSNTDRCSGISLYYPYYNKGQYAEMVSVYKEIGINGYSSLIDKLTRIWLRDKTRNWRISEPENEGEEVTLSLSDEQYADCSAAYYTVFYEDGGKLFPIMEKCKADIDERGTIHVSTNPKVICISDSSSAYCWSCTQIDKGDRQTIYKNFSRLNSDSIITQMDLTGLYKEDICGIQIVLNGDNESDKLRIQTVATSGSGVELGGKETIALSNYDGISLISCGYLPIKDNEGHWRPYSEWSKESATIRMATIEIENEINFYLKDADEILDGCVIQIEIEDTLGELYGSTPVYINYEENDNYSLTDETEEGIIEYDVYQDYVKVSKYKGKDEEVKIPETVMGVPVSVIGNSAFSSSLYTKQIILPSSLRIIESKAFFDSGIERISIPNGVNEIGRDAFASCENLKSVDFPETINKCGKGIFAYCYNLENITVEGKKNAKCGAFQLIDGVVFSSDGKILIAYPASKGIVYSVPEGTEIVDYAAFSGCKLETVIIPEGLMRINNSAFCDAEYLCPPDFPESLEYIGSHAFGIRKLPHIFQDEKNKAIKTDDLFIRLGKNVRHIGSGAFDIFTNRKFEVDQGNTMFSSVDNNLCNKSGDSLISVAMYNNTNIKIPDGIVGMDTDLLCFLNAFGFYVGNKKETFDIFFPESIKRIYSSNSAFEEIDNVCFHCLPESVVARYADSNGISWSDSMIISSGEYEEDTAYGKMIFVLYDEYAILREYSGTDSTITIPQFVCDRPVLEIGTGNGPVQVNVHEPENNSGIQSKYLKNITVPEGVTKISDYAFKEIEYPESGLENIILPDSVRYIGKNSIHFVYGTIMSSLPDSLEYLGNQCMDCQWEGDFVIPKSLSVIEPGAFDSISYYEQFIIDDGNEHFLSREGFLYDSSGTILIASPGNLSGTVEIPDGTFQIAEGSFSENHSITKVVLPESMKEIGDYAFYNQNNLEVIDFNENLEIIREKAFSSCAIKELEIPKNVKELGEYAFSGCQNLKRIQLNEGLLRIGKGTFKGCSNLSHIVFPNTLVSIGVDAFQSNIYSGSSEAGDFLYIGSNVEYIGRYYDSENDVYWKNCSNPFTGIAVKRFEVDESNQYYSSVDGMLTDKDKTVLIACPTCKEGEIYIPDSIISIETDCFISCREIIKVHIPNSVISIPGYTFYQLPENESGHNNKYLVTIYCHEGSYAEKYAIENEIPYELE